MATVCTCTGMVSDNRGVYRNMNIRSIEMSELKDMLAEMNERSVLYKTVKAEIKHRGHWKNKPRGVAFKKGEDTRRSDNRINKAKFGGLFK